MHVCKHVNTHVCKHACGGLGLMLELILLLNVRVSQSKLDLAHITSLLERLLSRSPVSLS